MSASLFYNKSLLHAVKTERQKLTFSSQLIVYLFIYLFIYFASPGSSRLFLFLYFHNNNIIYLSSIPKTKRRRQTVNRTLRSSCWTRSQSIPPNLCSAVIQHHPSRIFVCLIVTDISGVSRYVSSFTSGS